MEIIIDQVHPGYAIIGAAELLHGDKRMGCRELDNGDEHHHRGLFRGQSISEEDIKTGYTLLPIIPIFTPLRSPEGFLLKVNNYVYLFRGMFIFYDKRALHRIDFDLNSFNSACGKKGTPYKIITSFGKNYAIPQ